MANISEKASGANAQTGANAQSTATAQTKQATNTEPANNQEHLKKGLQNRHIQLIALGGAIGTGLFYGSTESIQLAGPSILLTYLLGGALIFLIVRALGEMSTYDP